MSPPPPPPLPPRDTGKGAPIASAVVAQKTHPLRPRDSRRERCRRLRRRHGACLLCLLLHGLPLSFWRASSLPPPLHQSRQKRLLRLCIVQQALAPPAAILGACCTAPVPRVRVLPQRPPQPGGGTARCRRRRLLRWPQASPQPENLSTVLGRLPPSPQRSRGARRTPRSAPSTVAGGHRRARATSRSSHGRRRHVKRQSCPGPCPPGSC
mmetsp:Transcript_33842/g.54288  ORF Transcript_33842/g.54288 Transcript_33842/m.54288 type:complete len:210 (-) Transcript_33842:380-1009(-)